jgi:hypothetical protein
MTMKLLNQNRWLKKARYEVSESGLIVFEKTLKSTYEEQIRFEDISNRISRIERRQPWLMALNLLATILAIKFLFAGELEWAALCIAIILVLFFVIHLSSSQLILIYLQSGLVVKIDSSIPDNETVERFIDDFVNEKRRYMVAKYASVDRDLPIEPQLNQLVWLRNEDYIDEKTLTELKNKLLGKEKENKIGFFRQDQEQDAS